MLHAVSSPLAGTTVKIKKGIKHFQFPEFGGCEFVVRDWQDRITGESWMHSEGNPACIVYALRSTDPPLPIDDEVLYGHVGIFGHLVHISELDI